MNSATLAYLNQNRGEDPETLAATLAADVRTINNIDRKALAAYLLTSGVRKKIQAFRALEGLPPELVPLQEALEELDFIITSGIDYIGTTDASISIQMAQLLGGLMMVEVITPEEANGFIALGGGYIYDRPTPEEIQGHFDHLDRLDECLIISTQAADGYNRVLGAIETALRDETPFPTWEELVALFTTPPA